MNYTSTIKAAILMAASMTFGTVMAASNAPVEMQRVEVAGSKSPDIARFDVKAACPGIAEELKDQLASAFDRFEATGIVKVQFRVQGNQVNEVIARGGPAEYRQPVRRTVSSLSCADMSGTNQLYAFEVSFSAPKAGSGGQVIALLTK